MSIVVLRLAGALQAWSGYRHAVSMNFVAPTERVPRKSALNGLLGAALGPVDSGFGSARDLTEVGGRYRLHVRVDTRNAPTEDFQVLSPLPPAAAAVAERSHRLTTASAERFPSSRAAGNFPTTVSRRDFLPHSEFIAAVETDPATADNWIGALREPVFMPYLGRRSCAPSFPFILGVHDGQVEDLFAELPWVDRHRTAEVLAGYAVYGDHDTHSAEDHSRQYRPPGMSRSGQLTWAKENLR